MYKPLVVDNIVEKDMFFRKMEPYLRKLKKATKLYHGVRSLKNKSKIIK